MIFEFDIPSCSRIVASIEAESFEDAVSRLMTLLPDSFAGCSGLGCGEGIGIVVEKDKISAAERG